LSAFSKEERVAFDDAIEGFNDALVVSKLVKVYRTDDQQMERSRDTIWRPQPYIMQSFAGLNQTANFGGVTQLAVPARINTVRSVPWEMVVTELRDKSQEGLIKEGAQQKLASDINVAVTNVICNEGTLFVKRTAAATGYDDIAQADAAMTEIGVQMDKRAIGLAARDYNAMAGNLAQRQNVQTKVLTAYEKAFVGSNAGFDTYKMDYTPRQLLAVPGAGVTINGAGQRFIPRATSTAVSGESDNVDNRVQTLNVTVGAGGAIKAGDAFTIPGVNSVHLITKLDTNQLKTFRIRSIVSGGGTAGANVITISPPIIAADSAPTLAEQQYRNVTATPASGATLTFLNTANGFMNPFWHGDAVELLPGVLPIPPGRGVDVMSGTTDQGIPVRLSRWIAGETMVPRYRLDTYFGVVNLQPEMTGIMMFSQP
jgi:hypothetical protein